MLTRVSYVETTARPWHSRRRPRRGGGGGGGVPHRLEPLHDGMRHRLLARRVAGDELEVGGEVLAVAHRREVAQLLQRRPRPLDLPRKRRATTSTSTPAVAVVGRLPRPEGVEEEVPVGARGGRSEGGRRARQVRPRPRAQPPPRARRRVVRLRHHVAVRHRAIGHEAEALGEGDPEADGVHAARARLGTHIGLGPLRRRQPEEPRAGCRPHDVVRAECGEAARHAAASGDGREWRAVAPPVAIGVVAGLLLHHEREYARHERVGEVGDALWRQQLRVLRHRLFLDGLERRADASAREQGRD